MICVLHFFSEVKNYSTTSVSLSAFHFQQYSDNAELIWRLGRAQYEIAMLKGKEGNQEAKLEFMKKGIAILLSINI